MVAGRIDRGSRLEAGFAALRWGVAGVLVVAAHVAVALLVLNWREPDAPAGQPPAAVMIDLAPLAVAPPATPEDVAPGPQQSESEPKPMPDTPAPVDDSRPDPTPALPVQMQTAEQPPLDSIPPEAPALEVKPDPPPPTQELQEKIPDLPKKEQAEAALAPPPPPPIAKVEKRPAEKTRDLDRRRQSRQDKRRVRQTTAPPKAQERPLDDAAAPSPGASIPASTSAETWKGDLIAHLNQYKRYPSNAAGYGTASVAFTINRSGQVLSSRLISSSGDHALDEEAVSLPRRASPVPAPPSGIGGASITLTVPVRFNR
jgi:periplasmic protein TonB